ncbi:MAG: (Fe-S)-binding protein [Opitutaceae bacterium]|jgi:heterodisulfide reductase subunit C/nitrate reductase gamma subunit
MTATREIFGNIPLLSQVVFYALTVVAMLIFSLGIWRRWKLWSLGETSEGWPRFRQDLAATLRFHGERLKVVLADAGLQRRVLGHGSGTWGHLLLYSGFVSLLLGTILLDLDKIASAISPALKFHKGAYYVIYEMTLDLLGIAFVLGCLVLAIRKLASKEALGKKGTIDLWVLALLALIGVSGYFLEAFRILWQQPTGVAAYCSPVGLALSSCLAEVGAQLAAELHFVVWWFHALLVLGFMAAIPYTKLLHFITGPINIFLSRGRLGSMSLLKMEEVEAKGRVGPQSIAHFKRQQLFSLDACMACGRCDEACPSLAVTPVLSPQRIVLGLRACMESKSKAIPESTIALSDWDASSISPEALWNCTTCSACVDVCPVRINHLEFILPLRRQYMAEGRLSGGAATALRRMQLNANPWGLPLTQRANWNTARK